MTNMKAKTALYAAVGAPVVAARKVGDRVTEIRATLSKEADNLGKSANKRVNVWATEGEKVVSRLSDGKMVDELAAKVDFEQVSEQVSRLRDQLEDMLATWRASFRPEKAAAARKASVTTTIKTEAAPKAVAKTSTTKKAAAPKAAAKKASATKATAKKSTTTNKAAAPKAAAKKAS